MLGPNVYLQSFESAAVCHECETGVEFYVDWGILPEPPDGWPCPRCDQWLFSLAEAKNNSRPES